MLKKTVTLILALAVICSAGLFTSYAVDGSSSTETVGAIAVEDRVNELKAEKEKLLEEYNDTTDLKTKLEIADKMLGKHFNFIKTLVSVLVIGVMLLGSIENAFAFGINGGDDISILSHAVSVASVENDITIGDVIISDSESDTVYVSTVSEDAELYRQDNKPILRNELEKVYDNDVEYQVTLRSHLFEEDGKYVFNGNDGNASR